MMKNLPPSNSKAESSAFGLLNEHIQRWIWQKGWEELRDAQEKSIPIILEGNSDVIIASATASGKTEAAFFPILSCMLLPQKQDSTVLYISPLKALINDQWERLDQLCKLIDISVIPWHGDISETKKKRFLKKPRGCLLITPESLESLLIHHGLALSGVFAHLLYIVVDELHAFIDSERGKQLQSQMHRIEIAIKRHVPRIGLSATLGEMRLAAEFLRPGAGNLVQIIEGKDNEQELKIIVKGYINSYPKLSLKDIGEHDEAKSNILQKIDTAQGTIAIAEHLFSTLRGSNNLIFPNSRSKVEFYSDQLRRSCEKLGIPNEFWAHHGNLSKDIREEAERAIKIGIQPTTIVATTTLELGIDIGAVKSIAQIGPAPSVASLRQRLGRSGRRKGEPAILRCYCLEDEIKENSPISDQLREGLIQTIAQIKLLTKGWYETPRIQSLHLSTLIQQLLSSLAQYGGLTAENAWTLLCESGIYSNLAKSEFSELLRGLAAKKVIYQDNTGLLLLDTLGERIVNHFSFYAAFLSENEFRIIYGGKPLGTLPLSRPVEKGTYIIFAGRRWKVISCSSESQTIEVEPAKGGKPPIFDGMAYKIQNLVREEMRAILAESGPIAFLDKMAMSQLVEARTAYFRLGLDQEYVLQHGNEVQIFTWQGDYVNDALALLLTCYGHCATNEGLSLVVFNTEVPVVKNTLQRIGREKTQSPEDLSKKIENKQREKWDLFLTEELLGKTFASNELDVDGATQVAAKISRH